MKRPGTAENAVCPKCKTYTPQTIPSRGMRQCVCGHQFALKDTERISGGKILGPDPKDKAK